MGVKPLDVGGVDDSPLNRPLRTHLEGYPMLASLNIFPYSLEDHVRQSHLLRGIDRCLDLQGLHQHLAKHYSHTGRPSIDPELMLRMLIVGYCYGIRSERRLCEEVQLNLAYRWFCRLSLEDAVPDHSTFSKNRHGRFRNPPMKAVQIST